MKTCPVCALDLEDTYLFCPDDGSSLGNLPVGSSEYESASTSSGSDDETAGAVVLYCPTCAAEYPLTFSGCPVHHVPLTRHRIPRLSNGGTDDRKQQSGSSTHAIVAERQPQHERSKPPKCLTTLDLKRPAIERPKSPAAITLNDDGESVQNKAVTEVSGNSTANEAAETFPSVITPFGYWEPPVDDHERGFERPGFRLAAVATVVALVVFGVVAMYKVISHFSRRSTAPAIQIASKTEDAPQPLPFVATPHEAQDYKEESPKTPTAPTPQPERPGERVRNQSPVPERAAPKIVQPVPKRPVATPAPTQVTRVSTPPMPSLPRGNSGGFDARLIRLRSQKTPAGVRYDLTFNMLEQAGRSAQWQRVLISTRSASGISRSLAIPFSHRLGATGALTFTISVEMTGRSEADWQGRVVCTTLGWDNNGGPLQTSFGANVTP